MTSLNLHLPQEVARKATGQVGFPPGRAGVRLLLRPQETGAKPEPQLPKHTPANSAPFPIPCTSERNRMMMENQKNKKNFKL